MNFTDRVPPHNRETEQLAATRVPPHSLEAERSVLGSMMRDSRCIPDVQLIIRPESIDDNFYMDCHRRMCRAIYDIHQKSSTVDLVLLGNALHATGEIEEAGGYQYLAQVYDETPTAANATFYAEIVAAKAEQRRYIYLSTDLAREAWTPHEGPGKLAEFAETLILEASTKQSGSKTAPLHKEYFAIADALDRPEPKQPGYPTGLPALDVMFSLESGTLTTIGARTSIGKSIMLAQFAHNLADQSLPTLLISLEMRRRELAERLMALRSGIRFTTLRGVSLADEFESQKAFEAVNELCNLPLQVNCEPQNLASIKAEARRAKLRFGLKALCVDYIQLIEAHREKGISRAEEVGQITKGLKRLAIDLDIVVVAACQLNREAENREEPTLADLRESGSIEQDSDSVILLWTDKNDADPDRVKGKIAKQRNGPKANFELTRSAAFMRFDPYIHRPSWVKKAD